MSTLAFVSVVNQAARNVGIQPTEFRRAELLDWLSRHTDWTLVRALRLVEFRLQAQA